MSQQANVTPDRYRTFRGREPAIWLAEFKEAGWPDLAAVAVTSFLMGFRPNAPDWEELASAKDRQQEAVASGAAATIAAQIASLEARPAHGYLAEQKPPLATGILVGYATALAIGAAVGLLL